MYSLFNSMPESLSAVTQIAGWSNLRDGLKRNLDAVMLYYRTHSMAVESDHFLVRLLQSIDVPLTLNLERYQDNVQSMSLNLSMALKMTSSIYRGQIFPGVFYGPDCSEVLIAVNDDFDAQEAHDNWTQLTPVTMLRHPVTDLGLRLPDGRNNSTDSGLAVIVINIPLLAVMYRAWRYDQFRREEEEGEQQHSTMQFVHMFVLPSMMPSHLDHVLFNRLLALKKGAPIGDVRRPHSFPLVDWRAKLGLFQERILDFLENNARDFRGIMQEVPMVSDKNLDYLMRLPDLAPTQQVMWALSISRLPILDFLFRVSKGGASIKNRSEVNLVLRQIKMYRRNSMMKVLPPDVLADVMFEINMIESQVTDINGM